MPTFRWLAASDQAAGLLGKYPRSVQGTVLILVRSLCLVHRSIQQGLTRRTVPAGQGRIGGLPEQEERHCPSVAVQQGDRIAAERECVYGRTRPQGEDSFSGARRCDVRVVRQQPQAGQLEIKVQPAERLRRLPAPSVE
jgi:hypothetical protein